MRSAGSGAGASGYEEIAAGCRPQCGGRHDRSSSAAATILLSSDPRLCK